MRKYKFDLVHDAEVLTDGRMRWTNPQRVHEWCKSEHAGQKVKVIIAREWERRSRQEEKYHWSVQCPLWGAHAGLRDVEAHYDLLEQCPVVAVDSEGEVVKKTSRQMSHEEYHVWVFEAVAQFLAEHGVECPEPGEVA